MVSDSRKTQGGGTSRLVIINDGSDDNTYDIVCSYAKERPLLQPLSKQNGGHGSTVLYGYRYAVQNEADYIFRQIQMGRLIHLNLTLSGRNVMNLMQL